MLTGFSIKLQDLPSIKSFFSLEHCITPLSSHFSDFNNLPIVSVLAPYSEKFQAEVLLTLA